MENKKTGSGDKFLDIAAYVLAILLFVKTADVMGYFSPDWLNGIFGLDVSFVYGVVNASLVEGMALALHFNHKAILSPAAQIVKWILVGISATCQVLDGYLSTGNAAQMSDTLKLTLQVGVPLIPIGVFVMLFLIGKLPDDGSVRQWKGVKNLVKPAWERFLNGDDYVESASNSFAQTVDEPQLALKAKKVKNTNP